MKPKKVSYEKLLALLDEAGEIRAPAQLFYDVRDYVSITKAQVLQILATSATPEVFEYEVRWNPDKRLLLIG